MAPLLGTKLQPHNCFGYASIYFGSTDALLRAQAPLERPHVIFPSLKLGQSD